MLELEVFIFKLLSVDGFSAHSISHGEVTALDHLWEQSMCDIILMRENSELKRKGVFASHYDNCSSFE